MNPREQFCPNADCPDRGKVDQGNIVSHSQQEQRCKCKTCGKTFAITHGTPFFGLKKDHSLFVLVTTLLANGCPVQAIVIAFCMDERTVSAWLQRAGIHCEQVHEATIGQAQLDLQQVQADEIKVKAAGGSFWMAFAIMVATRLWLGGDVSQHRDKKLIGRVMDRVRGVALCRPLLIAVDGLSSYVDATRKAFRTPLRLGKMGRPRLIAWADIHIVQVVKQRGAGTLSIARRIVQGCPDQIQRLIDTSQGSGGINTAFIERLNGTFRNRLGCLTRRCRRAARQAQTLTAGMWLVGTVYNFCTVHRSLRLPLWLSERRCHWVPRTPVMAAGLSDHCWSVAELLWYKIPPPPYDPPKRRGQSPKK